MDRAHSILVENIFSSQQVYVPNPPGFEKDTRTKILKKAVTAILANKFDDPAIAKYCLNVDGVVQQALRWATWKRDTSGNMEFGFGFRRWGNDPYHTELNHEEIFNFDSALDRFPNLFSYLRGRRVT